MNYRVYIGACLLLGVIVYFTYLNRLYAYLDAFPEKSLVVIIPSYNNARWYKKNLASVFSQRYSNYRVVYIDDCSTDQTGLLVEQYVQQCKHTARTEIIHNQTRQGVLANLYTAIHQCEPDVIIIDLDGDDWLKNPWVFKKINAAYQDPDVWMTYGQYETYPAGNKGICRALPQEVIKNNRYRTHPWTTSHVRTFYAGLFQQIALHDCLYNNAWCDVTNDQLFMFYLLELAGSHSRFIPEVLYVYNTTNSLNIFRICNDQEGPMETYIRQKSRYQPLIENPSICSVGNCMGRG